MRLLRPEPSDIPAPWIIDDRRDPPDAPQAPAWLPLPEAPEARPQEADAEPVHETPRGVIIIDL